jgi:chorismate mutase
VIEAELGKLRSKIDNIDESIIKLLLERIDCAKKVSSLKDKLNKNSKVSLIKNYDFNRENQIISKLKTEFNSLPENSIDIIFRQIISLCRNMQKYSNICLLGEFKNFDYKQYFGDFSNYIKTLDSTCWLKELSNSVFNIGVSECYIDENQLDKIDFELVGSIKNKNSLGDIKVYTHK